MGYRIVPITLREAQAFVDANHRHNSAPRGNKFSLGLMDDQLIGVAIVGRPIARGADNGLTAEILRVCVLDGKKNANSMLYGACCRVCRAMGYEAVITYTLPTESGASLRAAGFIQDGMTTHKKGWDTPSRPRTGPEKNPIGVKIRWKKEVSNGK